MPVSDSMDHSTLPGVEGSGVMTNISTIIYIYAYIYRLIGYSLFNIHATSLIIYLKNENLMQNVLISYGYSLFLNSSFGSVATASSTRTPPTALLPEVLKSSGVG